MDDNHSIFLGSLGLGILIWLFFYIVTPITIPNELSGYSITFIGINYLALICGYFLSYKRFKILDQKISTISKSLGHPGAMWFLIIVVICSWAIRYVDLFSVRDVSLSSTMVLNRAKAGKAENFSLGMNLVSMFRVLYFVPFVLVCVSNKKQSRMLIIFSVILFMLPLPEGILRGSRRMIFESIVLFTMIAFLFGKIKLRSIKTFSAIFLGSIVLLLFSKSIIDTRIIETNQTKPDLIFRAPYSEFVPATEKIKAIILNNEDNLLGKILYSGTHLGQYMAHSVYEMDYMIAQNPKHKYGCYNGVLLIKLFNKLGLTKIPLSGLSNPTGRNTYISTFGWLFLDFGWLSMLVMFCFGVFQRFVLSVERKSIVLFPITMVLLFCNLFLLVFNFMRAQFVITLIVYCFFVLGLAFGSRYFSNFKWCSKVALKL